MKLRVWWIPQIPGKPFIVYVETIAEAVLLLRTLAKYDLFQLANNIKPDYANAGGLSVWDEEDKEWIDWYDEEGQDIEHYLKADRMKTADKEKA